MAILIPEAWSGNPHMEPGEARVLRIPRFADGAVGWPGGHRIY